MRFARPLVVALFILVIVVTPLSAITSGGSFETWVGGDYDRPVVRVTLHDQTGLVRNFTAARLDGRGLLRNPQGNQRMLVVSLWGGCGDYWVHLDFRRTDAGYVLRQSNSEFGCGLLPLLGHGDVALSLWAPVDASTVELDSPYNLGE